MEEKLDDQQIIQRLRQKKDEGRDKIVTLSQWLQPNKNITIAVNVTDHPCNHFSEYHTHAFFEINYVFSGSGINLIENEIVYMEQGDAIIMCPGTFHTLYCDSESKIYNFIINKDWFSREVQRFLSRDNALYTFIDKIENEDFYKYVVCPLKGNEIVAKAAESVINRFNEESFSRFVMSEAAMLEFMAILIEQSKDAYLSHSVNSKDQKLMSILVYVAENYSTVTLEELSEKFFYSKTHICRLFITHTGKSFNQTLMQMKVNHACKYLKNTDMSVEEISRQVGYDSVEYFQRLFKKKIGKTPGEYRKSGVADNVLC